MQVPPFRQFKNIHAFVWRLTIFSVLTDAIANNKDINIKEKFLKIIFFSF
jgi:hypothetical protein